MARAVFRRLYHGNASFVISFRYWT